MSVIEDMLSRIDELQDHVARLETMEAQKWKMLATSLTSTSWDGDAYSTTAKTSIDLSAVFGAPAGLKAVLIKIQARDSASAAATTGCWIVLSPNNTSGSGPIHRIAGIPNDVYHADMLEVPCDVNGDIYYQIDASGAGTMDVIIEIWGYLR